MMFKRVGRFFDKLEDRVRARLSHRQILYGFVGGVGVVLFWRGVWHTADYIFLRLFGVGYEMTTIDLAELWDGLFSGAIGAVLLLITGLFVSSFIGNEIIISGLRGEKKLAEKTEGEVEAEENILEEIRRRLARIEKDIGELKNKK